MGIIVAVGAIEEDAVDIMEGVTRGMADLNGTMGGSPTTPGGTVEEAGVTTVDAVWVEGVNLCVHGPMDDTAGTMAVRWGVNGAQRATKTTRTRIRWNFALSFGRNGAASGTMSAGSATLSSPTPSMP